MTDDRDSIPGDWDALVDRGADGGPPSHSATEPDPLEPPMLTVMASAWADLVGILAVCTAALVAILVLGELPLRYWSSFGRQPRECCSRA
jgi:hypothetical protein